jgi:hypothetical protein
MLKGPSGTPASNAGHRARPDRSDSNGVARRERTALSQPGRRLKQKFYLVNLHFNNHGCTRESYPLPSWVYQVLLVNKRIGILDTSATTPTLLSPLDAPDALLRPDCQLPSS